MEFRILGPLEVLEHGNLLTLPGARERAVLVYLLLNSGQMVSADKLVEELWGEEPPETARKSLQVRVAGIRKALGADVVITQGPGYTVRLKPHDLDLRRFEQLVASADGVGPEFAAPKLRQALSLWRGPPLADFTYEPFAQAAIGRLEELKIAALEQRIDADLALGRHADLVGELEALVGVHPLRERIRGQLMLALYRSGRQAEALEAFQAERRALVEAFGIEPGRALQELERAILQQDKGITLESVPAPERSILVVLRTERHSEQLAGLAESLARTPRKELILARIVADRSELTRAAASVEDLRRRLIAAGVSARAAAFVSPEPAVDIDRMAADQDVDLVLIDSLGQLADDHVLLGVLADAPCDVGVVFDAVPRTGPVVVPFVGAPHDWAAVELGAWAAGALELPLLLAGPRDLSEGGRDASRLLADASLAVQRALGVVASPLLLAPEVGALLGAVKDAALVVLGLPDDWRTKGLGVARDALASQAPAPVIVVRRGLRPGGLAPRQTLTRFTWTVASGTPASGPTAAAGA